MVAFLETRGYDIVRRYAISELDVTAAPDPDPAGIALTTFAARPDLAEQLYAIACEAYPDQPGRAEKRMSPFEIWRSWGLDPHPADAYFIALDGRACARLRVPRARRRAVEERLPGDSRATPAAAVSPRAIKRAQIAWAKANGVATLRTANELRLPQMLALNERFGYRPLYTELVLRGPCA